MYEISAVFNPENMQTHIQRVHTILYVKNQSESKLFYQKMLRINPILDVPGMTEFEISAGFILGLMPESGAARLLGNLLPHPETGSGIPRCELYLMVSDPDAEYSNALLCGALALSAPSMRDWGHHVGYVADNDGHIIGFAATV
jgi:hypothetical protein